MGRDKDFSVDQKVIFWSAIATLLAIFPVLWMGLALTIFSVMLALIPYNLVARIFGDFVQELLVVVSLLSYASGLGLVLGAYWILTRGVRILFHRGLGIELSSQIFDKIKIACGIVVNLLFFLFLYVFFPAGPGAYP